MSDDDDDVMQRRTSGDDDESVLLPAFINKLLKMLSDPECADTIQYGSDGTTLLVVDSSLFATKVLPRFFKHSNFASFVRQLNLYGFHKTTQDPDVCEFQHKHFRRDKPELLRNIKRKISTEKVDVSKAKGELDELLGSVAELKGRQAQFENALLQKELEKQMLYQEVVNAQQRQRVLEEKISKLAWVLMKACNALSQQQAGGGPKRPRLSG
eukprot:CAMPEP_0172169524 /NCGR_PEP_ID=MMETSP1050-20130122/10749_1 /TAXON_ID=233186 /ORGANISM="Cryptomonas curvata, Strain CCAP979/52" /LENGTH=211 /DNA_ID=CAMNT_0012840583 /DNA_START=257 /DNA_END=889 /DNA_ORIENTATION=-